MIGDGLNKGHAIGEDMDIVDIQYFCIVMEDDEEGIRAYGPHMGAALPARQGPMPSLAQP